MTGREARAEAGVGAAAETLGSLLERLASRAPTPGGGAAAALGGAVAAALVGMVCRVTSARSGVAEGLAALEAEADRLRRRLTALIAEDAEAYGQVLAARAAPTERRQRALEAATRVPLEVARSSEGVLALCDALVSRARASTLGDLGVAASLAWAALESAALTARVNLKGLGEVGFVAAARAELERLSGSGGGLRERVLRGVLDHVQGRSIDHEGRSVTGAD